MIGRRGIFGLGLLGLLFPRVAWSCTEVIHGKAPQWKAKVSPGTFSCTVEGHYTETHDLVAAGVRRHAWVSNRDAKRMPELLGLRTAFLDWFLTTYQALGGARAEAIDQVQYVVDAWKNNTRCVVTEHGQRQEPR